MTAFVLLAPGSLIGEGFDHPPLDTLVLVMPISWKGTLQQYAGRQHREYAAKRDVRIYNYVKQDHPQLRRMWEKRLRGYRDMGYEIRMGRDDSCSFLVMSKISIDEIQMVNHLYLLMILLSKLNFLSCK